MTNHLHSAKNTWNGLLCMTFLSLFFTFSCKNASNAPANLSQEVSIDQVEDLVKNEGYKLIDLRTTEEVTSLGTIPFSHMIDFKADNFSQRLDKLNKDDGYIIYCKSGGRSGRALKMFNKKGFTNVKEMGEGYDAWAKKYK